MLDQISAVIITRNAADTLAGTLASLSRFPEVVVYDNGSDDATLEIAMGFDNVCVHQGQFLGFGPTKNHAVTLAKNDWVLSLDADESIPVELAQYLEGWKPADENVVGVIRRDNHFMGRLVDKGGWGDNWLVRLFNRNMHRFNDNAVHEFVPLTSHSRAEKLPFPIRHDAVRRIGDFLVKIDRYSEIHRQTSRKAFHPAIIVLRCIAAFIKSYLLKGGLFAGWRGLVIAWNESNGVFFKYMKVYADQNP